MKLETEEKLRMTASIGLAIAVVIGITIAVYFRRSRSHIIAKNHNWLIQSFIL